MTALSPDSADRRPDDPPGPATPGYAYPPGPATPGYAYPPGPAAPGYAYQSGFAGPSSGFAAPPPVGPAGQPLASFSDRLLAYLIDAGLLLAAILAILVPALIVLVNAVWLPAIDSAAADPFDDDALALRLVGWTLAAQAVGTVLSLAISYVYHVEIMFRTGQTVGKRVMKLRVAPLGPAGALTRATAAKRYLAQFVGGTLLPGFAYADGLWQLWDRPYLQCLHDKFAGTVVIKVAAP